MQLSPCRRATWESSVAVLVVWTETKHFTWRLIQTGEMKNGVNGCFCVNSHLLISCLWKIWYHGFVEAGGVLWDPILPLLPEQVPQSRSCSIVPTRVLNTLREGQYTTSLHSLSQCSHSSKYQSWRHLAVTCWTSIAAYQSSQCVVRWNSCARYFAWSSLYWLCLLQTSWVFPCPLKSVVWL